MKAVTGGRITLGNYGDSYFRFSIKELADIDSATVSLVANGNAATYPVLLTVQHVGNELEVNCYKLRGTNCPRLVPTACSVEVNWIAFGDTHCECGIECHGICASDLN